jgi:MoaA/NifB/PqqE/SkfB family radical SAM enzyme
LKQHALVFDKTFRNDKYLLLFNTSTGLEILQGVNGHPDPFALYLPSLIDVGIMGTCVHSCPFCYQGRKKEPNMKLGHFMSIIDQVKHHTNQIALGGRGDPNKHPQFKEIVEYCRKNNVVPNYTTSGIDLTDDEIEISKLCGAVAVSDYEKDYTYDALKRFMDAGIKTNIHQIFHRGTFEKCSQIVDGFNVWLVHADGPKKSLVDIERLNAVIFLLFKPQGSGRAMLDCVPTTYHLSTFAEKVFNPKCKFKIGMDSCMVNQVLNFTKPAELQRMSIDTCEAGRMSAYITPDMKFKPCSFEKNKDSIDLLETSIEKAWTDGEIFQRYRQQLKVVGNMCPIGF